MPKITPLKALLIFLAITGLILYLIFRTSFPNTIFPGFSQTVASWKKIWQEDPPQPGLTQEEKDKIKGRIKKEEDPAVFCQSAYFPLLPGANWSYLATSGEETDIINIEIPAEENGIYYLDSRLKSRTNWTVRTGFKCQGDIIALSDLNFLMTTQKQGINTTPCKEGLFSLSFPKDSSFQEGNIREESLCLINKADDTETKEETRIKWRVGRDEEIKLTPGIFHTKKITGEMETVTGEDTIKADLIIWVARGIGIVKIQYREKEINGTVSHKPAITQEMESFQIPTEREYKYRNLQ